MPRPQRTDFSELLDFQIHTLRVYEAFYALHTQQKSPRYQIHVRYRCEFCGLIGEAQWQFFKKRKNKCQCQSPLAVARKLRIPFYIYNLFIAMHSRCNDSNNKDFPDYGGRGISVCPEWGDILEFYKYIGERPDSDMSLDRIDNSRGYEPGNVRWATWVEQARNRRSTKHWLELNGQVIHLADFIQLSGKERTTVYRKYNKALRSNDEFFMGAKILRDFH